MAQTIAEHLIEQGEARGELRFARRILRVLLTKLYGSLPESVLMRIEACENLQRLQQAVVNAHDLAKLEDLEL